MPLRSAAKSSASPAALAVSGAPVGVKGRRDAIVGDAASPKALARLEGAIAELKALAVEPLLRQALSALHADDPKGACDWALKALGQDSRAGMAWYVLGVACETAGDFASSIKAYEAALALLDDPTEVANDLGRLAYRMGMKEIAEQLFRRHLEARPGSYEAANNLACAVRDLDRPAEAIEILRAAITARPQEPVLWNSLGTVVFDQGDLETAITFFDEALRLNPAFGQALHNRANAWVILGELDAALVDCEAAISAAGDEGERLMMKLARSTVQMARGRLGEGWDDYEARLAPRFAGVTRFLVERPAWTPAAPLAGKTLLLMGEQGLGDEVLFANIIPDVLRTLGPDGKLILAVEPRLVPLLQRSFPTAEVGGHITRAFEGQTLRAAPFIEDPSRIDLWAPLASPLRRFRRNIEDFPAGDRFLVPDPDRVRHWRRLLETAPAGLKVGLLWKSMKIEASRAHYFSPFELWAPVLKTPGVTFVSVQYGDCDEELAWAERTLGVSLWRPPGIDLKDDLDDVAALTAALDLTIGFANATSNIAAACGAPTWFISVPGAWTRLGTARMPWYPKARVFLPPGYGRWAETMDAVAAALAEIVCDSGTG